MNRVNSVYSLFQMFIAVSYHEENSDFWSISAGENSQQINNSWNSLAQNSRYVSG